MKILLTGMTAAQHSEQHASRVLTYMSAIRQSLPEDAEVVWKAPSVEMDDSYIRSFDRVVVGVSSPMSLASNHAYGALSVIESAWRSDRLRLVVDAPEPFKVVSGLRSIVADPDRLTKPLFAGRTGYSALLSQSVRERVFGAVERLVQDEWPTTLAPVLPWSSTTFLERHIPNVSGRVCALNLDSIFLEKRGCRFASVIDDGFWVADEPGTTYIRRLEPLLRWDVEPWRAGKWATLEESAERLSKATGALLTTFRAGEPWWSPLLPLALSEGLPVVTDWNLTVGVLPAAWSLLPAHVEDASSALRSAYVEEQQDSYLFAIPSAANCREDVPNAIW